MTIQHETIPIWRQRLPLIVGVSVLILAIIILVSILGSGQQSQLVSSTPLSDSPGIASSELPSTLTAISDSLELFGREYAKIASGTPKDKTGALDALNKAQATFYQAERSLSAISSDQVQAIDANLVTLQTVLNADKPDQSTVILTLVRVNQHLGALLTMLQKPGAQ